MINKLWFIDEDFFKPIFKEFLKVHKHLFYLNTFEYYNLYYNNLFKPFRVSLREIDNYYISYRKRFLRAFKRINYIINNYDYVYFVTFTFDDIHISNYEKSFKNYRLKNLAKYCYIGNIDYGSNTNRVHYHFVIGSSFAITKDILKYKLGFLDIKRCNSNSKAISKYILNLTKHSFKRNIRLIYSRLT